MKSFLFIFLSVFQISIYAQVVINEVSHTNHLFLKDEDGSYPDWIELYNSSDQSVNMLNWSLSDSKNEKKWLLPDFNIDPKSHVLIFASGKNKTIVDNNTIVNHWETAVMEDDDWSYFIGDKEPPSNWFAFDFDPILWQKAKGGFGYGDNDDNTQVPEGSLSVYYRIQLEINNPNLIAKAILSMDYDDSFVAYLNGVEIARNNIIGSVPAFNAPTITDHEAALYTGGKPESFEIKDEILQSSIRKDKNVLCIQVNNVASSSSDLSARTWLHFGINSSQRLYRSNPSWFDASAGTGNKVNLHTNFKLTRDELLVLVDNLGSLKDSIRLNSQFMHSRVRIPDGASWCYSDSPSPSVSNGIDCKSEYSLLPDLIPQSGFYQAGLTVIISGTNCRYTTDGSDPTSSSLLYTNPIAISKSTVLKVRCYEPGKLPGEIMTASYFINQNNSLPVVSISSAPRNLFNDGSNGPAVYDKARGFTQSEKTFCHIEYFDRNNKLLFKDKASLTPVGNYSLDFGQKSLQFVFDEDWGASSEEIPNIFKNDKPNLKNLHGFRIRNLDDDASSARMRDVISNRMGILTASGAGAYQNVAVYINGNYWGHYAAREILDKYFMQDNYGADPDSVNLVKTSYSVKPDYYPEEGSSKSFFELSDFITKSDLTNELNYNKVLEEIDIENWVDYYANEIYNNNQDWYPSQYFNNIRLAECTKPKVKWKYILWDMGISQGNSAGVYDDLLKTCLDNSQIPNRYQDMMKSLLKNEQFRNYFINRFLDLLNETWNTPRILKMIDANAAELAPEIRKNNSRWGSIDSTNWRANVSYLKQFHRERPAIQRLHIQNYFKLGKQVEVSLDVTPKAAGVIKISTIVPDSLPWKGSYFNGNPVVITAIANPGYKFSHWTSNNEIFDTMQSSIQLDIKNNSLFRAVFSGSPQAVEIEFSEINYNSDSTISAGDWIEIHNLMNTDLDISGFAISDNQIANQYKFPNNTILKKNDYLVVSSDVDKFKLRHPLVKNYVGPVSFDLNNKGENIQLLDRAGTVIVSMSYADSLDWPCTADGYGRTLELKTERADPNKATSWFDGCMNGSPGTSFKPCNHSLLITEINYKSLPTKDAGDWIELYNNTSSALNLSAWKIGDLGSNIYSLPANTILNANQYLVVVQDLTKFKSQFPNVKNVIGSMVFGFDGNGDIIRISNNRQELQYSICYDDTDPFPLKADGEGYTLELKDYAGNVNDGKNWFDGCPGGSPGIKYDPNCGSTIVKNINSSDILIYPNPVHDELNIKFSENIHMNNVRIFNSLAEQVIFEYINSQTININLPLNKYPSGIYLIQIQDIDSEIRTFKFIKN